MQITVKIASFWLVVATSFPGSVGLFLHCCFPLLSFRAFRRISSGLYVGGVGGFIVLFCCLGLRLTFHSALTFGLNTCIFASIIVRFFSLGDFFRRRTLTLKITVLFEGVSFGFYSIIALFLVIIITLCRLILWRWLRKGCGSSLLELPQPVPCI